MLTLGDASLAPVTSRESGELMKASLGVWMGDESRMEATAAAAAAGVRAAAEEEDVEAKGKRAGVEELARMGLSDCCWLGTTGEGLTGSA